MAALKNQRHEAFCQFVVQGRYQSESYKLAGYKNISNENARKAASQLATRPDVQARIQELSNQINEERIKAAVQVSITPHFIINELLADRRKAQQRNNPDIAVRCLTEIARIAGLYKLTEGHGGAVNISIDLGSDSGSKPIEGEFEEVSLIEPSTTLEDE